MKCETSKDSHLTFLEGKCFFFCFTSAADGIAKEGKYEVTEKCKKKRKNSEKKNKYARWLLATAIKMRIHFILTKISGSSSRKKRSSSLKKENTCKKKNLNDNAINSMK